MSSSSFDEYVSYTMYPMVTKSKLVDFAAKSVTLSKKKEEVTGLGILVESVICYKYEKMEQGWISLKIVVR